jgi:hypothetical protein
MSTPSTDLGSFELLGFDHVQQLSFFAAEQTLRLRVHTKIRYLPPLATLTALQTLELVQLMLLHQLPSLVSQTALDTIYLHGCDRLQRLP